MIIRRSIYASERQNDRVRGQSSSISLGIKDWHAESEKPPHHLTPHRTHALLHLNIWQTMKVQPLKCLRSASGMKWGDKRIPLGNQQGYELAVSFRWGGGYRIGCIFNSFVIQFFWKHQSREDDKSNLMLLQQMVKEGGIGTWYHLKSGKSVL